MQKQKIYQRQMILIHTDNFEIDIIYLPIFIISGTCATRKPCLNNGICRDVGLHSFNCTCLPNYSGVSCQNYTSATSTPRASSPLPSTHHPPRTTPARMTSPRTTPARMTSPKTTPARMTSPKTTSARMTTPNTIQTRRTTPRTSTYPRKPNMTTPSNPCTPNPCKNGALCSNRNSAAKCQCISGFTGQFCETPMCSTSYCQNGGSCQVIKNVRSCRCNAFYTGKYCETHVLCAPNPCRQNASCIAVDDANFQCICPPGYAGNICQFVDKCRVSPCQNGGNCLNTNAGLLLFSSTMSSVPSAPTDFRHLKDRSI